MKRKYFINDLCRELKLEVIGKNVEICELVLCNRFVESDKSLSYAVNSSYVDFIAQSPFINSLVVCKSDVSVYQNIGREITLIVAENPEDTFYKIHFFLLERTDFYASEKSDSKIGENCTIHPTAIIFDGTEIGNNVSIGAHTIISCGTSIGNNVKIGCNTTIGTDGFQIIKIDGRNVAIPHCGGVRIGDDSYIGDNVTINKSLFGGFTEIGRNVMIDSQTYIAHNVSIGDNCVVCAQSTFCGSCTIKENSFIGVNSSIKNRIIIEKNVTVGMGSTVVKNVPSESLVFGSSAKIH